MPQFRVGQFVQVDPQGIRDGGHGEGLVDAYYDAFGRGHMVEVLSADTGSGYMRVLSHYKLSKGDHRNNATFGFIKIKFFKPLGPPETTREMSYLLLSKLESA